MYHCNVAANCQRPGSTGAPSRFTTAKVVLKQIESFYGKANIPMVTERRACEKIIKLLDDNNKLRSIDKSRRDTPYTKRKLEDMQLMLASTFQLWPPNVESLIKNPEDLAFLKSMQSNRSASFGAFDKVLAQKIARRQVRDVAALKRLKHARGEIETLQLSVLSEVLTDGSNEDSSDESEESACVSEDDVDLRTKSGSKDEIPPKSKKPTGTMAFIPPDLLSRPNLVSLATRLKMTPTQQAAFTQGLITESGGDVSMVASSYATADRARRKVVGEIATQIQDNWQPPKLLTLHWDGKLTPTLNNPRITEERMTVVVGDASQLKLLGVKSYFKSKDMSVGEIIANLTSKLLMEWHCSDRIINMTFDTTSSNTGHLTAACIAIQAKLHRALLWSGCRHHVGEVLLSHVFTDLKIEASKSPDVTLFTRLQSNWDLMPHNSTQTVPFRPADHNIQAQQLLSTMKAEMIAHAAKDVEFLRDDYQEFTELSLVYLSASKDEVKFRRPGALHKARWMAKLIYSLKIALFEMQIGELPPGTITTRHQVAKMRRFATFIIHVYGVWWITCKNAVDSPWNDLQLYKRLLEYEVVDKDMSQSAIRAFNRHLWYLTAEMIPLALFSGCVPISERQALADALLKLRPVNALEAPLNRFGNGWGKPRFPLSIECSTRLCDLVGVDSWFTINRLQLDTSFLEIPASEWSKSDAYISSAANVEALNVVNDCAERGVKLASDFVATARSDEHFQHVLQVVEKDRKDTPNLRRKRCNSQVL